MQLADQEIKRVAQEPVNDLELVLMQMVQALDLLDTTTTIEIITEMDQTVDPHHLHRVVAHHLHLAVIIDEKFKNWINETLSATVL